MGLDISAYSKLSKCECDPEDYDSDFVVHIYNDESFDNIERPFEKTKFYETIYKRYSFGAGSYGGYNDWRKILCNLILKCNPSEVWNNPIEYEGKPFVELINFSDCEGTIGTEISEKLYKDFETFQSEIDKLEDEYFKERYIKWKNAFDVARDCGLVKFH